VLIGASSHGPPEKISSAVPARRTDPSRCHRFSHCQKQNAPSAAGPSGDAPSSSGRCRTRDNSAHGDVKNTCNGRPSSAVTPSAATVPTAEHLVSFKLESSPGLPKSVASAGGGVKERQVPLLPNPPHGRCSGLCRAGLPPQQHHRLE
jgi:hypothetical protein